MNDFELRRQLRELRTSVQPQSNLWPLIARQITAPAQAATLSVRRRSRLPWALAASLVMASSAGVLFLALQERVASTDITADLGKRPDVSEQIQRARELAASGDPRLASAEIVLDNASSELDLALQQQPDAVFLVGLINRTHAQQRKVARLGLGAG